MIASETEVRKLRFDDLECLLSWRNDPMIRNGMLKQHEISLEEHRDWFANASRDPRRHLLIFENRGVATGFVQFFDPAGHGVADWGFYAAPRAPKGTGRMLGATALDFAFDDIGLHKVCGQVLDSNQASIGLHRAIGFEQEGVLHDHWRIDEKYHHLICFGLRRLNWQKAISEKGA